MLRDIREASANWIGKTIMLVVVGFLIISFAIWGIGDVFRGFGRSTVAQIGNTEITIEQFRRLFNDRLQELSRQLRRPLTLDQARALGLDRQLLAQLAAETTLDERARKLRLGLDDAVIAEKIKEDPNFKGLSGQFDRTRFEQVIRQAGYTEPRYVALERQAALRRQLSQTVAGDPHVPRTIVEALHRYQNAQRSIDYIVLDAGAAGEIPPPTQEQLAKYFEERKALFRAPEYRKIVALVMTPEDVARWIEVSDADAKQAFETNRDRINIPEKRHVQQILFADEAAARAVSERIAKGATFAALAKEPDIKDRFTDLGTLAKNAIVDQALADAAFSLKAGEASAPLKGRFGTVIVHVVKVEPAVVRSYEEVAPQIKAQVALERAKTQVADNYDKIEDERAAGRNLTEIGQKLKLDVRTFEAVDRAKRGPDGKPVENLPQFADVVSAAFASDVGVENDPLQSQGKYVWYEVAGITPSRERTLDEVKTDVEARWRNDEIAKRLKAKAEAMVDKLKAGGKLADLATDGPKVETASALQRERPTDAIPAKAITEIFRTPKNGAGSAEGDDATKRLVFVVKELSLPPLDMAAAETKSLTEVLNRQYGSELLGQYLARLQSDFGVSVNDTALNQAIGVPTN